MSSASLESPPSLDFSSSDSEDGQVALPYFSRDEKATIASDYKQDFLQSSSLGLPSELLPKQWHFNASYQSHSQR